MENESIPCDMLILSTSQEGGIAYVETKQIDGETNLKQKYSIYELQTSYHIENSIHFVITLSIIRRKKTMLSSSMIKRILFYTNYQAHIKLVAKRFNN